MEIDPMEWRPITFEEVVMPQSLMAITVSSLGRIAALARKAGETCRWSAPVHPDDPLGTPEGRNRFLRALEASKGQAPE